MGRVDMTLYEHDDLKGATYNIRFGSDFVKVPGAPAGVNWGRTLHDRQWGDVVSSILVREGYIALFEHEDFNGAIFKFGPGSEVYRLGAYGWNDVASSYIACTERFDPVEMAVRIRRLR